MSTVTTDYKSELGRLKKVYDLNTFYGGMESVNPLTMKQLANDLNVDKRAPAFQRLLTEKRIYTEGHFSFHVPKTKAGNKLIEECTKSEASGQNPPLEMMLTAFDRIAEENAEKPEWLGIRGINDRGHYLIENNEGGISQVNGWFFETVFKYSKGATINFESPNKPITFYKSGKLVGCLMPEWDAKTKLIDHVLIDGDRWDFHDFQRFDYVTFEVGKLITADGRSKMDGKFFDSIFGYSAKFEIDRREEDWCIWMRHGQRTIDIELIGKFESKKRALQAVDDIAAHASGVNSSGQLEFAI